MREQYEAELSECIRKGWLVCYDEAVCGPVKGQIPLMAVSQVNKNKVKSVFDFREVN